MSTETRPDPPFPAEAGYRWEPAEDGDEWMVAPSLKKCRSLKCPNRVAAFLFRKGRKRSGWWGYCTEHLYGRWIKDGKVALAAGPGRSPSVNLNDPATAAATLADLASI